MVDEKNINEVKPVDAPIETPPKVFVEQKFVKEKFGSEQVAESPDSGQDKRRVMKRFPRRKVCYFCVEKINYIDYKDIKKIKRFVTERGKILPRRISGNCSFHQRKLTSAIKCARNIALLPFKVE